jgi:uncharacterized protein (DUF1919 family)
MQYKTPFVGLFLFAPCYIKMISNLEYFLHSKLSFTNTSKYCISNGLSTSTANGHFNWPIGLLGDGIELHFQHYKDEQEARTKWLRRLKRMNMQRLFFIFSDRDYCAIEHLEQFERMPYKHKVCFTARQYPRFESAIYLPEYQGAPHVGDITTEFNICRRHFSYIDWLNGHTGKSDWQNSTIGHPSPDN